MIMRLSDDLSMKCMVTGNVDPAVVPDETIIHLHAAVMVEGASDGVIPEINIPGGSFYALMGFLYGWHDHGSDVFWQQNYYLVVVILSLIVVCLSGEKVCLLVGSTGFMMKGKVVFC